ncbi:MAG: protein kinase [Planctomycetaceae bacterium]|nr:protein kinase [Planctomycetaceae bacterium]
MPEDSHQPGRKITQQELIDQLCDRFEVAWQDELKPLIEDYLLEAAPEDQSQVLWELIALEVELRQRSGVIATYSDYATRFASHSKIVADIFRDQETQVSPDQKENTAAKASGKAAPPTFPGTERFEIIRQLGQGGFGQVFHVHDHQFHDDCALKVLTVPEGASLYRFKREFRVLAGMAHPHLVGLKELFAEQDYWFFTMDLIDGAPLNKVLSETTSIASRPDAFYERIAFLLDQLLDGLGALHQAGFVHRDLKPANVLVTKKDRVIILDLGLASSMQGSVPEWQQSVEVGIAGTVAYMAPEQAREQFSPASDCYAVGVMLFEMLTGTRPFQGSVLAVLQNKQNFDAPEVRDLLPNIAPFWNDLCRDLLSREAEKRPDVEQIRERLRQKMDVVPAAPRTIRSVRTEFVGREMELQKLKDLAQRTHSGTPAVIFVHALSGVGKTSLVEHFLEELTHQQDKTLILSSRCYDRESVPHKAFDGVIDAISRHLNKLTISEARLMLPRNIGDLVRLFPVLQRVDAITEQMGDYQPPSDVQESRRRAVTAFRQILERLSEQHHVVISIDDLQWGDRDSARLFEELLLQPDSPQLLTVSTYRTDERDRSDCLSLLFAEEARQKWPEQRVWDFPLADLSPDDARKLVETCNSQLKLTEAEMSGIAREAGGSPFFILELTRHKASGTESVVSLEDVIRNRISGMTATARTLLEVLAICGQPLAMRELLEIGGTTRSDIDSLRNENLIRISGTTDLTFVECYHDRIREAIAAELSATTVSERHGQLVRVFQKYQRIDAQTMARHLEGAGRKAEALEQYHQAAAFATQQLAFDQAARLYLRILELSEDPQPEHQATLHARIAEAYAYDGQALRAASHYQDAARISNDPLQSFEWSRLAMMRLFQAGQLESAHQILERLLGNVGLTYPASMTQIIRGIVWEKSLQQIPVPARSLLTTRRDQTRSEQRVKTCWAATQSLSILDPLRGAYFQLVGEREAVNQSPFAESYQLRAYGACLLAASGQSKDLSRARLQLESIRSDPKYPATHYLDAFLEMCEGAIDYLTSDFVLAIERCVKAADAYTTNCPEAWWEADLSRMFAHFSCNFSGDIRQLRHLMATDPSIRLRRETTYHDLMIHGVSEILLNIADDDLSTAAGRSAELAGLLDFEQFNNLHFNYYLRHFWELRYQGKGFECWEKLIEMEPRFRAALLHKHHWSRHAYALHRATSAIAACQELRGVSGTREEQCSRLLTDAEQMILRLRKEQHQCCSAEADLLEAGLAALRQTGMAVSLLRNALHKFRASRMKLFEAICLDRLQQQTGSVGSQDQAIREDYLTEHQIRNSEKFFDLFSPGFFQE